MPLLEQFFFLSLLVQIVHAVEELITGFHKKWYAFKWSFNAFLTFEILFEGFWIAVYLFPAFPYRQNLQMLFLPLMFANSVQHIIWAATKKEYVPGLITAPLHGIVFLLYYFQIHL